MTQCETPASGYQKYPGLLKAEYESKQSYNIVNIHTGQIVGTSTAYPQFDGTYWAGTDCSNLAQRIMLKAKTALSGVTDIALTFNDQSDLWTESFRNEKIAFQSPLSKTSKQQKLLRRGDVIHYDGHMTIVHQEKPSCLDKNSITKCTYEIIHAYGRDGYTDEDNVNHFMRKVVKMPNQVIYGGNKELMPAPTGFGRVKLWE